jgi:hypothetical protein
MGPPSESGARKDQHTMETVLPFDKLPPESQASTGGKGGTLARLFQAGHPVPDGLVILLALAGNPDWCRDTRRRSEAMHSKEKLATLVVEGLKPRSLASFRRNHATSPGLMSGPGSATRSWEDMPGSASCSSHSFGTWISVWQFSTPNRSRGHPLSSRAIRPDKPSTRPGGMRVELSCCSTFTAPTQAEE